MRSSVLWNVSEALNPSHDASDFEVNSVHAVLSEVLVLSTGDFCDQVTADSAGFATLVIDLPIDSFDDGACAALDPSLPVLRGGEFIVHAPTTTFRASSSFKSSGHGNASYAKKVHAPLDYKPRQAGWNQQVSEEENPNLQSGNTFAWTAFDAATPYSVLPVREGHKICLEYQIFHAPDASPPPAIAPSPVIVRQDAVAVLHHLLPIHPHAKQLEE